MKKTALVLGLAGALLLTGVAGGNFTVKDDSRKVAMFVVKDLRPHFAPPHKHTKYTVRKCRTRDSRNGSCRFTLRGAVDCRGRMATRETRGAALWVWIKRMRCAKP